MLILLLELTIFRKKSKFKSWEPRAMRPSRSATYVHCRAMGTSPVSPPPQHSISPPSGSIQRGVRLRLEIVSCRG